MKRFGTVPEGRNEKDGKTSQRDYWAHRAPSVESENRKERERQKQFKKDQEKQRREDAYLDRKYNREDARKAQPGGCWQNWMNGTDPGYNKKLP